jgi:hypothetical protein
MSLWLSYSRPGAQLHPCQISPRRVLAWLREARGGQLAEADVCVDKFRPWVVCLVVFAFYYCRAK